MALEIERETERQRKRERSSTAETDARQLKTMPAEHEVRSCVVPRFVVRVILHIGLGSQEPADVAYTKLEVLPVL